MAEPFEPGCARPKRKTAPATAAQEAHGREEQKEKVNVVLIGNKAPDFTAPAFHQGKFVNLTLSEYLGKWVLLCFYPGDFTFV